MSNSVPIHSVQNIIELLADPVHYPITIGSDNFIITQQDQRNILDRRTWYLTHIPNQLPASNSSPLPQNDHLQHLLQQLAAVIGQFQSGINPGNQALLPKPFQFHYEKQTSTEDLVYHMRRIGLPVEPTTTLVKHVHFVVDRSSQRDKGTVMNGLETLTAEENRMVCDCDEGNSASSEQEPRENALDRIRRMKEKDSEYW